MVSGTEDGMGAPRAVLRGAFDYVTKPIDMVYLLQTVQTAIGSSIRWWPQRDAIELT
jgi:DNA-binding NtrC family response regulator